MVRHDRVAVLVAALAMSAGCAGAGDGGADADTMATPDAKPDADAGAAPDAASDTLPPDAGCPGAVGCPCAVRADCDSGACVETPDGGRCAPGDCGPACPRGRSCRRSAGAWHCTANTAALCRPCHTDEDCIEDGDAGGLCVELGPDGRFCGGACQVELDCPEGFACAEARGAAGAMRRQCLPVDGACPCPDVFLGYATTCHVSNAFGTCRGERTCDVACPAAPAAPETCNGKDDDCDGEVDEGAGDCPEGHPCVAAACLP